MSGKNRTRRKPRAAVFVIIALLSLTLLSAPIVRAQVFHYTNYTASQFDDKGEAYLITPMGQLSTFLYPVGVILKNALRAEVLFISGADHLPDEKRFKYLHPDFPRSDDGTAFLYQDLADMMRGRNLR